MEVISNQFINSQKNLIINSRLKKQSLFIELTNIYNTKNKKEKNSQLYDLKKFGDSIKNKEILIGLGFIYGNIKILEKNYIDFLFKIIYKEKPLRHVLDDLNSSMPILKKNEPLKRHHDRLYFDQQSVLEGIIHINKQGDESLVNLLDPRYEFKKDLFKKLSRYINNIRKDCSIYSIGHKNILSNIDIIRGVTLEDYIFKIFNEDLNNDTYTYKRHGYNTCKIANNFNSTREIDIIVTGNNIMPLLKKVSESGITDFYPKEFYERFTS